jgi:hypothetical protein
MKIKNRSWSQLVLNLSEGKSITLPGRGSVDINEGDFNSPECQRLFAERAIIVLPEQKKEDSSAGGTTDSTSTSEGEATDTTPSAEGETTDTDKTS